MSRSANSSGRVGHYPETTASQDEPGSSLPPVDPAIDPRLYDSSYLDVGSDVDDVGAQDITASMSLGQRRLLQEQVDLSESDDDSDDDGSWDEGGDM
jgi:general transcription factor 3C polypeptide 3 (transcription factor C subunit 4)